MYRKSLLYPAVYIEDPYNGKCSIVPISPVYVVGDIGYTNGYAANFSNYHSSQKPDNSSNDKAYWDELAAFYNNEYPFPCNSLSHWVVLHSYQSDKQMSYPHNIAVEQQGVIPAREAVSD